MGVKSEGGGEKSEHEEVGGKREGVHFFSLMLGCFVSMKLSCEIIYYKSRVMHVL
jgi:hypothetical protein